MELNGEKGFIKLTSKIGNEVLVLAIVVVVVILID